MSTTLIRPLVLQDSKKMWEIRNHPLVRNQSKNTDPISWEDHQEWLNNYLDNPNNSCYVLLSNNKIAGYCRIDTTNNHAIVSIAIDPKQSRKGFGSKLLQYTIHKTQKNLEATVKKDNIASYNFFTKNRFYSKSEDDTYHYLQYTK